MMPKLNLQSVTFIFCCFGSDSDEILHYLTSNFLHISYDFIILHVLYIKYVQAHKGRKSKIVVTLY